MQKEKKREGQPRNPEASDVNYISVKQVLISQPSARFISITHCNVQIFNNPFGDYISCCSLRFDRCHKSTLQALVQIFKRGRLSCLLNEVCSGTSTAAHSSSGL